jgi:hypothetical protein
MTQTQQRSLISIIFIALIAGLIVSLFGLNGSWVCWILAGVLVLLPDVTGVRLSTEVFVLDGVITETPDWAS